MSNHSDEHEEEGQKTVKGWYKEFVETRHFLSLSDTEKKNAMFLISGFTQYMSSYEGEDPDEWSLDSMVMVCTEVFPEKITADLECFESVGPVLNAFFQFLGEMGYQARAAHLGEKVLTIQNRIILNAKNPAKWGMAKSFAMSAGKSGHDLSDPVQAKGFMSNYNAQRFATMLGQELDEGLSVIDLRKNTQLAQQKKDKRKAQKAARKKSRSK